MQFRVIILFGVVLMSMLCLGLQAEQRDEAVTLDDIANLYKSGDISGLEEELEQFEPANETEIAAKLYYQARITVNQDKMAALWKELTKKYPETEYGQKGLIQLAQLSLLERRYDESREYLLSVSADNTERDYLLATVYLKLNSFPSAISAAQRYINTSPDKEKRELAYLNIVEAHILSRNYAAALTVLNQIRSEGHIVNQGCLVTFKEGYILEMIDKISDAVRKYKQVITHYPYTEHSYQAEKRLYDLTITDRISSAELTTPAPGRTDIETSTPVISEDREYYYVQVNAFSSSTNANNHSLHLKRSGFENRVISRVVSGQNLYVVAIGPYAARVEAVEAQQKVKERLNLDSFLIRH